MKIGVLALQGAFAAHADTLASIGHATREVRVAADLDGLDGLVFPGGESSTMLNLIGRAELWAPLDRFVRSGRPTLLTCAGLILGATNVANPSQESFGWLDVDVVRNGWGRQVHSFEATGDLLGGPLVFIRAPTIARVGETVETVETFEGAPVMVRQGAIVGAAYHPELTDDATVHKLAFPAVDRSDAAASEV